MYLENILGVFILFLILYLKRINKNKISKVNKLKNHENNSSREDLLISEKTIDLYDFLDNSSKILFIFNKNKICIYKNKKANLLFKNVLSYEDFYENIKKNSSLSEKYYIELQNNNSFIFNFLNKKSLISMEKNNFGFFLSITPLDFLENIIQQSLSFDYILQFVLPHINNPIVIEENNLVKYSNNSIISKNSFFDKKTQNFEFFKKFTLPNKQIMLIKDSNISNLYKIIKKQFREEIINIKEEKDLKILEQKILNNILPYKKEKVLLINLEERINAIIYKMSKYLYCSIENIEIKDMNFYCFLNLNFLKALIKKICFLSMKYSEEKFLIFNFKNKEINSSIAIKVNKEIFSKKEIKDFFSHFSSKDIFIVSFEEDFNLFGLKIQREKNI